MAKYLTTQIRNRIYKAYLRHFNKFECFYCKEQVFKDVENSHPRKSTIDHFIPINQGGKTVRRNLVIACNFCNYNKGAKSPSMDLFNKLKKCSIYYKVTGQKISFKQIE